MTDIRENQRDEDNEINYLHMKAFLLPRQSVRSISKMSKQRNQIFMHCD